MRRADPQEVNDRILRALYQSALRRAETAERQLQQIEKVMDGYIVRGDGTVGPLNERIGMLAMLTRACGATECRGDCDVERLKAFVRADDECADLKAQKLRLKGFAWHRSSCALGTTHWRDGDEAYCDCGFADAIVGQKDSE